MHGVITMVAETLEELISEGFTAIGDVTDEGGDDSE